MVQGAKERVRIGRRIKDMQRDTAILYRLIDRGPTGITSAPAKIDLARAIFNIADDALFGSQGFVPVIIQITSNVVDIVGGITPDAFGLGGTGLTDIMLFPETGTEDDLVTINTGTVLPKSGQRVRFCGTNINNTIHIKDTGNIVPFNGAFDLIAKNVIDFFYDITLAKWVQTASGAVCPNGGTGLVFPITTVIKEKTV